MRLYLEQNYQCSFKLSKEYWVALQITPPGGGASIIAMKLQTPILATVWLCFIGFSRLYSPKNHISFCGIRPRAIYDKSFHFLPYFNLGGKSLSACSPKQIKSIF